MLKILKFKQECIKILRIFKKTKSMFETLEFKRNFRVCLQFFLLFVREENFLVLKNFRKFSNVKKVLSLFME